MPLNVSSLALVLSTPATVTTLPTANPCDAEVVRVAMPAVYALFVTERVTLDTGVEAIFVPVRSYVNDVDVGIEDTSYVPSSVESTFST